MTKSRELSSPEVTGEIHLSPSDVGGDTSSSLDGLSASVLPVPVVLIVVTPAPLVVTSVIAIVTASVRPVSVLIVVASSVVVVTSIIVVMTSRTSAASESVMVMSRAGPKLGRRGSEAEGGGCSLLSGEKVSLLGGH